MNKNKNVREILSIIIEHILSQFRIETNTTVQNLLSLNDILRDGAAST